MIRGARTDVGRRREQNEDNYFSYSGKNLCYAIVADGMGGHNAGEIASSISVNSIREYLSKNLTGMETVDDTVKILEKAFETANKNIYDTACGKFSIIGMGTTTTLAMIKGDKLITAHVGDSRVYEIANEQITQITSDHSYVNELVKLGKITEEQAKNHPKKNYITRAMGTEPEVKSDISVRDYNGEIVLLCSDGLSNMVSDSEIAEIVLNSKNYEKAAKKLVEKANSNGGIDNITVVIFSEKKSEVLGR